MKMKMLPNTLNSKNRLFFERDSKNRRITSKIGNVFRNSKWSDYSVKNTNSINKSEFTTIIITIVKTIITIFFILFSLSYLNSSISIFIIKVLNCIFDVIDFTDLSISRFLENSKFSFFLVSQLFWKSIFEKLFSNITELPYINSNSYRLKPQYLNNQNTNQFNNINSSITNINIIKLPVISNISNDAILLNNLISSTLQQSYKNNLNSLRPSFTDNKSFNTKFDNYFSQTFFNSNKWSIQNSKFSNSVSNSFYINHLNYQFLNNLILNKNIQLASINVVNQNNIAKTLRWSYRYSNLHRKTILNSHKLTSVKKLLGSGFFDSTSTKNNIWFSDNFSRIDTFTNLSKTLNTHWLMMYKSNLGIKQFNNYLTSNCLPSVNQNFNFLSFYESSFQFFLKRLYLYSGLDSNIFSSKPYLAIDKKSLEFNSLNSYTLYLNNFFKRSTLMNDLFNPFKGITTSKQSKEFTSFNTLDKDINVSIVDSDFLLNDNLELLININNSLLLKGSTIKFFDINNNIVFKSTNHEPKAKRNF